MHIFDEMKAYVGFGERDERHLREFWRQCVEPGADHVVTAFYDRVEQSPITRRILTDRATVERLRVTLHQWLFELCTGPWDQAYYERRQRIGKVHVDVGLPHRFMFAAMSVIRQQLHRMAIGTYPVDEAISVCEAIDKITEMDLSIMTQHYAKVRSDARLANLEEVIVSHLPVTVLLCTADGRVVASTRPGVSLFDANDDGVITLDEALPDDLIAAADLWNQLERSATSRRDITLVRVDVERGDGRRSFKIQLVPLPREPVQILLHIAELTETVESEARLRRSESLAQLGALSAAVAHELRNPLAGISGAIQVMTGTFSAADPRRDVMGKVRDQITRLNHLVTDLLAFARPHEPQMGTVDLRGVCEFVVATLAAEHTSAQFEVEGRGSAWADSDLVHQILFNLVANAVQASGPDGRVMVQVGAGMILVTDDGPGVPESLRRKVFEPFFTTRQRGTGLGLAICRNASTAMGGHLSLVEGPLSGAAFRLRLEEADEALQGE